MRPPRSRRCPARGGRGPRAACGTWTCPRWPAARRGGRCRGGHGGVRVDAAHGHDGAEGQAAQGGAALRDIAGGIPRGEGSPPSSPPRSRQSRARGRRGKRGPGIRLRSCAERLIPAAQALCVSLPQSFHTTQSAASTQRSILSYTSRSSRYSSTAWGATIRGDAPAVIRSQGSPRSGRRGSSRRQEAGRCGASTSSHRRGVFRRIPAAGRGVYRRRGRA